MAKTVFVVFDTDLEKVVGVYSKQEAAEDCESSSPGDRYTLEMVLEKTYNENTDPRALIDDEPSDIRSNSYDDEDFYDRDEDEEDEDEDEVNED